MKGRVKMVRVEAVVQILTRTAKAFPEVSIARLCRRMS